MIHILICDIGGAHRRRMARVKTAAPIIFYVHPPPRRRQRRAAPLHFTPLSYFTASPRVKCRRKGAFFFSIVFLLLRRRLYSCWRAAVRHFLCARGGACVIDAPRWQCYALDIYPKIGYISWFIGRKKLYIKTFSTAYSPNGMILCVANDSTMRLAVESDSFRSNRRIVDYSGSPLQNSRLICWEMYLKFTETGSRPSRKDRPVDLVFIQGFLCWWIQC